MTRPLTEQDLEYIKQAKTIIASLLMIVESAEDHPEDGNYTFYLDAARDYVRDADKWVENAERVLHHYEMDLVRAAVSTAHYTTNLFIERCGYVIPLANEVIPVSEVVED